MSNRKIITALLFALLLPCAAASAQDGKHRSKISWPAVEGAGGYIVEITTVSGDIVYKGESETNLAYPALAVGEYKLRITVLDRFRHPANETKWVVLSIIKTEVPQFDSISPDPLETGKPVTVGIKGDNFTEGCSVVLSGPAEIKGERVAVKSESSLGCLFDLTSAPSGEYDLYITNAAGKRSLGYRKVRIQSPAAAQTKLSIRSFRPSSFRMNGKDVVIDIDCDGIEKGYPVVLSNGSDRFEAKAESYGEGKVTAVIPAAKQSRGRYDLTIGPDGRKDTAVRGIRMMDVSDGLIGLNGLYFGLGWSGTVVLPSWNSILQDSLMGGGMYLGHSLYGLPLVPDSLLLNRVGIELQAEGHIFETKNFENRFTGRLYTFPVSAGVYGSVLPRWFPVELLVRADVGAAYSTLDVKVNAAKKKLSSTDPFLTAGMSLRRPFAGYFFAEAGGGWSYYIFRSSPLSGIGFFFRAGLCL